MMNTAPTPSRTRTGSELSGVAETAIIALWARAAEIRHPVPLFRDAKAIELVDLIDYDFGKFKNSWKTQASVAIRTWILDSEISNYLNTYPDSVIINLGAGLDNRFSRMDNGFISWYDIDLPAVIELKKCFFKETERYRLIDSSIFDFTWMKVIEAGRRPVLFIAEGLLMYFETSDIMALFDGLIGNFAGAHMFLELLAPGAVGSHYQDTDNIMNIEFKWSLLNSRDLQAMHEKLRFVDEWCVLDFFRERWNWIGRCAEIPMFRNYFGEKIVHVKFL